MVNLSGRVGPSVAMFKGIGTLASVLERTPSAQAPPPSSDAGQRHCFCDARSALLSLDAT
jgi:hypothetical protein